MASIMEKFNAREKNILAATTTRENRRIFSLLISLEFIFETGPKFIFVLASNFNLCLCLFLCNWSRSFLCVFHISSSIFYLSFFFSLLLSLSVSLFLSFVSFFFSYSLSFASFILISFILFYFFFLIPFSR